LCFIYDWKHDADPSNDENLQINFRGGGTITVGGEIEDPIDELDGTYTQAELDAEFGAGRGGIRVATQVSNGVPGTDPSDYGNDRNIQRSYEFLWDAGILRSNNQSGLTGYDFDDFFTTVNDPGENDYQLISKTLAGDYNSDHKVDAADYVVWRKTLGATADADLDADGDGNLVVDQADFELWKANFGDMLMPGGGVGSSVPEPGTMLLLIIGVASLLASRSRVS
jgi:hypothetical protein